MIQTSAPTRFDLAGAPTDVEPFKSEEGGYVVNACLDLRVSVSVSASSATSEIVVASQDLGVEERFSSIEAIDREGVLRLIKAVITHVHPEQGLHVTTSTGVPPGSGLGASAALAVALLSAVRQVRGESPTLEELVNDALYVENVMLGITNGGQDQYAAALGGFHAFEFGPESVTVKPLHPNMEFLRALTERSVLCHSGESHLSGQILDQVMTNYTDGDRQTIASLRSMKRFAQEAEQAVLEGSIDGLGESISGVGEMQHCLHPAVTPPAVERLLQIARENGALAAKMAGAGGGGCVYFLCEPGRKEELEGVFQSCGVQVLPMMFSLAGLRTID